MSISGEIIKYVQNSERLIVVTIVVFLSGIVAYWSEQRGVFEFADLPNWVRPACVLAWIAAGVHVAIRLSMTFGTGMKGISQFLAVIPQRRRQAAADQPIIDKLLTMRGIAREVLCYARYRDDSHIWVSGSVKHNWLAELKRAGLVELSDAEFDTAHYRIHRVAWKYMRKYPNRFVSTVPWEGPPWTLRLNEREIERLIEAA